MIPASKSVSSDDRDGIAGTLARLRYVGRIINHTIRIARCLRVTKSREFDADLRDVVEALDRIRRAAQQDAGALVERQVQKVEHLHAAGAYRINLGCGRRALAAWTNLDLDYGDVTLDVRWGLPFADESASHIYAAHALEHLAFRGEALTFLKEAYRVLQPGGALRLLVPDLGRYIAAYVRGDDAFFVARKEYWPWTARLRTHLEHVLTYAGAGAPVTDFFGHKFGYDDETLTDLLGQAGFVDMERSGFMQSVDPVFRIDAQSDPGSAAVNGESYSLFMEARRPPRTPPAS